MGTFFQAAAAVLVASVLGLTLSGMGKDMTALLTVSVCCGLLIVAFSFLKPIMEFFDRLRSLGNLNNDMVQLLLKVVGIGIVAEIASMVCSDAGNASMGKSLQFLASCVILWLSLPVFQELLELIQQIVGGI